MKFYPIIHSAICCIIGAAFPTQVSAQQGPESTACFKIETLWEDDIPSTADPSHGTDFWRSNRKRPVQGAKVEIRTASGSLSLSEFTDRRGCVSFSPPTRTYQLEIFSEGEVNGIVIRSFSDWVATSTGFDNTGEFRIASWMIEVSPSLRDSLGPPVDEYIIPDNADRIAWHSYLLVAFALRRSDYNLGNFGNSTNCDTAGVPCCEHEPVFGTDPKTIITFTGREGWAASSQWQHADTGSFRGFGDLFDTDANGNGIIDDDETRIPAVGIGRTDRWFLAHELGHVLVMMRMGERTSTFNQAPLHGCNGGYLSARCRRPS